MVWFLILLAIAMWFVAGVFVVKMNNKIESNTNEVLASDPINNEEFKKFMQTETFKKIMNLTVERDYE